MSVNARRSVGGLAQVLLVLAILVSINLLASRFFYRADLTEDKLYTVSGSTRNVLQRLDDVISIRVYFSQDLPPYLATLDREVKDLLDEYSARGGENVLVEFLDPSGDPVQERAVQTLGIPKVQLNIIQQDKAEVVNAFLGIAVQYGDRTEVIPIVQSADNLEYELTEAIVKVTSDEKTVAFVGPADVGPFQNMTGLRQVLERQYRLVPADPGSGPVDLSINTLIVVDHDGLSDLALYHIDQFVMGGGRLLVMAAGVDVPEGGLNGSDRGVRMSRLLDVYGVAVAPALIVDAQSAMASFSQGYMSFTVAYPWWPQIPASGLSPESPITAGMDALTLPWTSPVELMAADPASSVTGVVLVRSSARSFARSAPYDMNPQAQVVLPELGVESQPAAVALTGSFTSAWAAGGAVPGDTLGTAQPKTESPETQMVIVGSWRFAEDSFLQQFPSNAVFLANTVDWMTLGGDLIEIRSRTGSGRPLRGIEDAERQTLKLLGILGMPVAVILAGLVGLRLRQFRRRRLAAAYGGAA